MSPIDAVKAKLMIEKWAIVVVLCSACLIAAYLKGRNDVENKYEFAETKFIIKTEVVKEQDKAAMLKLKRQIKSLETQNADLIKQALIAPRNPPQCDLGDDRVRRINQAGAGLLEGSDGTVR
jgi:hypothetical protein